MDSVNSQKLADWRHGKRFYVTDNRALIIFEQKSLTEDSSEFGKRIIIFDSFSTTTAPDGSESLVIIFNDGKHILRHDTRRSPSDAMLSMTSMSVPMLVDMDVVEKADRILTGRKVWTLTPLWYDIEGNRQPGLKYTAVTVTGVEPGNMVFPLRIRFTNGDSEAYMYMSATENSTDSRTFASLFSLSDPKKNYPSITDEIWQLIRNGRLQKGMTKEECRLSIGNPKNVDSGHNYSQTLDIWQYPDGSYLLFADGQLIEYRN